MTNEEKLNAIGGSAKRQLFLLANLQYENKHFKGLVSDPSINYIFSQAIRNYDSTIGQLRHKLTGRSMEFIESEMSEDKLMALGSIIGFLSSCTLEQLEFIEDEFLKTKKPAQ